MKKTIWEVKYLSTIPVIKYCKKCGRKTSFVCSEAFRVNAQRKSLDIWLIYKCSNCDSTWNMTIFSRVNPKSLSLEELDGFHANNINVVKKYAMNIELIHKNGAETGVPEYIILGDTIDFSYPTELTIKSPYSLNIKISNILREKLNLSQKNFYNMINSGEIKSLSATDLKKLKLQTNNILIIEKLTL